MNGNEFKTIFETFFPTELAYEWDNVGLQIGTLNKSITHVLLTLDLTMEVIDEATTLGANLIVAHHPLLFHAIKDIKTDTYLGKMIEKLLAQNITLYVAHTNFDVSTYGMNTILANMLKLKNQKIMEFTTETEGLGRYGTLAEPLTVKSFVQFLKEVFCLEQVRYIGNKNATISTVAIAGGSGSSLINSALTLGVDVYVTGDITYHFALDAKNMGLNIVDIGHNIEKHSLESLKLFLLEKGVSVPITLSKIDTNPYTFM